MYRCTGNLRTLVRGIAPPLATACMLWSSFFGWGAQVMMARDVANTMKLQFEELLVLNGEHGGGGSGGWQWNMYGGVQALVQRLNAVRHWAGVEVPDEDGFVENMWYGTPTSSGAADPYLGVQSHLTAPFAKMWDDGSVRATGFSTVDFNFGAGEFVVNAVLTEDGVTRTINQSVTLTENGFSSWGDISVSTALASSTSYSGGFTSTYGAMSLDPGSDPGFDDESENMGAGGLGCAARSAFMPPCPPLWVAIGVVVVVVLVLTFICWLFCSVMDAFVQMFQQNFTPERRNNPWSQLVAYA